ncbi:MAG: hypothetical protein GKS06_11660 [Acidobacteria bacterium]|nr:hypothetical protein [Acidobacteriota bacterium]
MSVNGTAAELELGMEAIGLLLDRAGVPAEPGDADVLMAFASETEADESSQRRFAVIADSALQGFFHLAAEGYPFVSVERFQAQFGDSLEKNYPGAGAAFMRLAASYWTLHMLHGRINTRFSGTGLQQVLRFVEDRVGQAFFPEDDRLDAEQLARVQRRLIAQSGADIDVEQFLLGNPLLVGNPLAD